MTVVYAPMESADFFQHYGWFLRVTVAEVLGEDQKIPAFFNGPLGYVQSIRV